MPQGQATELSQSKVTVRFGDGVQSFLLGEGATMTELASRIGDLGDQHFGEPISIVVAFANSLKGAQTRSHLAH